MPATSFARAGFNLDVDFERVAMVQLWMGLGVALFFMPVLTILLSVLEPPEIAAGSGVAPIFRTLAGRFARSLTPWAWTPLTVLQHPHPHNTTPQTPPSTH